MRVAISSGKGGTGKTTITASLASVWPNFLVAIDMDVEEPNLGLFLKPEITGSYIAFIDIPKIDESKCTYCGTCSDFCQFSAISVINDHILTFPEMCHGCGGCEKLCPEKAIHYGKRKLGEISWGKTDSLDFLMGKLRIGEAMSPPLMREINNQLSKIFNKSYDIIVDSPPGTSCPAMNAVMKSDIILLVTEPTPFGLYDLKLAYDAFFDLKIPMAVVINKFGMGNDDVIYFCNSCKIPILAKIPFDLDIAFSYSKAEIIANTSSELKILFFNLCNEIKQINTKGL